MALSAVASLIAAPTRDRWLFQAPVAIYAGWLTAASCVSIGSTMAGFGFVTDAFGWAFIGISLGLALSLFAFRLRPSAPEYLLTVVWALIGIVVANGAELISVSGFAGIGILVLLAVIFRVRRTSVLPNQMNRNLPEVTQQ
jgi:hypothetical protein